MNITKKIKDLNKSHPFKHTNNFIDNVIVVVGLICMFLGGYCLVDNYNVYNKADITQTLGYKPTVTEDGITFDDVSNAIAWLQIPDTHIDYPIMQGKDNLEYINKDCFGKYSLAGSIFLDFKNDSSFINDYNIIYGHHMAGGKMFGDLEKFMDNNFFSKHLTGYLLIRDKVYRITFARCFETSAYDKEVFSLDIDNSARKFYNGKKTVALTTCKTTTDTNRTVLIGELEEISKEQYRGEYDGRN